MQPIICRNCGAGFTGNYCNQCGEKVYSEHDKTLSHVFEEVVHFFTHFDSKFLKTFWLIFAKPGFVSKEFCEGKRKSYYSPVNLFLLGIFIYLLAPQIQGMNISLGNHISNNRSLGIKYSLNWALHKLEKPGMTEAILVENFNHLSQKLAKILLLVLLPLSALFLRLIFWNKKRLFFDHFILSSEFNSFNLFGFFLLVPVIFKLLSAIFHINIEYGDSPPYLSFHAISVFIALVFSFRHFYKARYPEAILKSVLFILCFLVSFFIYRQLVFILVMLFI